MNLAQIDQTIKKSGGLVSLNKLLPFIDQSLVEKPKLISRWHFSHQCPVTWASIADQLESIGYSVSYLTWDYFIGPRKYND